MFRRFVCIFVFVGYSFILSLAGCVRFTEKDYELQEKAYQKQQAEEKIADREKVQIRW